MIRSFQATRGRQIGVYKSMKKSIYGERNCETNKKCSVKINTRLNIFKANDADKQSGYTRFTLAGATERFKL
jgi:hypothetical protein